jgi:BioD-like phosphotransacetylase family protein
MTKNAVYIGATGQNVGKTTLCLGILAAMKKRYSTVGFIKPVGQQHVKIHNDINVDKDVVLFKQHFNLPEDWEYMSPVIIPAGFTRKYLDGEINELAMEEKIRLSFNKIYSQNAFTIVEGTGHIGVGSIVNLNNAKIASMLGLDMVIIASGGLGMAYDELALNIEMCNYHGVKIRGIILNRVYDDKREMILEYFPKSLRKQNIPLLGCVPYNEFLNTPTLEDFENLFNTPILSGKQHRYRHFMHVRLVAGSIKSYLDERLVPNELIITPASREDVIEAILSASHTFYGGLILTSKIPPTESLLAQIKSSDIPILYTPIGSYDAMKRITSFSAKTRSEDILKIEKAISLVETHVDFELLSSEC